VALAEQRSFSSEKSSSDGDSSFGEPLARFCQSDLQHLFALFSILVYVCTHL
jgi:hypothetical protein